VDVQICEAGAPLAPLLDAEVMYVDWAWWKCIYWPVLRITEKQVMPTCSIRVVLTFLVLWNMSN
jgi:hypothetical protein